MKRRKMYFDDVRSKSCGEEVRQLERSSNCLKFSYLERAVCIDTLHEEGEDSAEHWADRVPGSILLKAGGIPSLESRPVKRSFHDLYHHRRVQENLTRASGLLSRTRRESRLTTAHTMAFRALLSR